MLHGDATRLREPRLMPADDDDPGQLESESFSEDEFDPEIPTPPGAFHPHDAGSTATAPSTRRLRFAPIAVAALAVAGIGGVTWIAYDALAPQSAGEIPYITAEVGPEKIRPQDAGGLQVPNQDIRVYNELSGAPADPEAEVLLPEPEAPVAPPVLAEIPESAEPSDVPSISAPDVDPAAGSVDGSADGEVTTAAEGEPTAPASSAASAPAAATPSPAPAAPAAPQPSIQTAALAGAYRIQLVAVRTQEAAQAAWTKMTKAHPEILAGLEPQVIRVDRGANDTIYRVQGGPFADRAGAEKACGRLKQKRQDCLVVSP
jgi:cell division septation protein DedD